MLIQKFHVHQFQLWWNKIVMYLLIYMQSLMSTIVLKIEEQLRLSSFLEK